MYVIEPNSPSSALPLPCLLIDIDHIWDNRVLPSFIIEKDGEFATTMFNHPDTACNEQNLNSAIAKPAHGEKVSLSNVKKGHTYRIENQSLPDYYKIL